MEQEPNKDILKGLIYSEFLESEFRPKIWNPHSLPFDKIVKVIEKATVHFSIRDEENWAKKISVLPISFYKFLGITYFYKRSTEDVYASLTILINENSSDFFYRNINRLKQDLEILAEALNKKNNQGLILSEYYTNLLIFIDRYQNFRKITDTKEKIEDIRKGCALLTYFDTKYGPKPFYCYPDNFLTEKQQQRLNKELERGLEEGLFVKGFHDFSAIQLYFELKSELARGKVEMCLISLVLEELPSKEMVDNISFRLLDLIDIINLKPKVFLGFYERKNGIKEDLNKIMQMKEFIQNWVRDVYRSCIEDYFKKASEGEYARILMDLNRIKLIDKLSESPIELKKLKNWVKNTLGKEIDFEGLLSPLIDYDLVTINEASGTDYAILLKGLRAYRTSPTNTLEKLKSFGSIYPEIYPDLLKQYSRKISQFFRKYRSTKKETVLLSKMIYDPINYLIISKLRKGGIYLKSDFEESFGTSFQNFATHNLKFLKEHDIITEIKADNEIFILLKTDIKFAKIIPKYILLGKKKKDLLPEPLKDINNTISKIPEPIKDIFKRWFG